MKFKYIIGQTGYIENSAKVYSQKQAKKEKKKRKIQTAGGMDDLFNLRLKQVSVYSHGHTNKAYNLVS